MLRFIWKNSHNFPNRFKVMLVILAMELATLVLIFTNESDGPLFVFFIVLTLVYWGIRFYKWGGKTLDEALAESSERIKAEREAK